MRSEDRAEGYPSLTSFKCSVSSKTAFAVTPLLDLSYLSSQSKARQQSQPCRCSVRSASTSPHWRHQVRKLQTAAFVTSLDRTKYRHNRSSAQQRSRRPLTPLSLLSKMTRQGLSISSGQNYGLQKEHFPQGEELTAPPPRTALAATHPSQYIHSSAQKPGNASANRPLTAKPTRPSSIAAVTTSSAARSRSNTNSGHWPPWAIYKDPMHQTNHKPLDASL